MVYQSNINSILKVFATIVSVLISLVSCSKEESYPYPAAGDHLPSFALTTDRGVRITELHLSTGNCVLVFFSTACPDCQRELPVIDKFYRENPDKTVIAISREEKEQDVISLWRDLSLTLPYSIQKDRKIYDMFTDSGVPYVVLVHRGVIIATFTDKDDLTTEMLTQQFNTI